MDFLAPRPPKMTYTLRALAWLLRYPDAGLRGLAPALVVALRDEAALDAARLAEFDALATRLASGDAIATEAEYVELFDRGRRTSLHLFEHVHGDSRDRGQAMVDLTQTYERAGLVLAPKLEAPLKHIEFVNLKPGRALVLGLPGEDRRRPGEARLFTTGWQPGLHVGPLALYRASRSVFTSR